MKKVPDVVYDGSFFVLCFIIVVAFLFTRNWVALKKVVLGSVLVEYLFLVLSTTVLFRETQAEAHYMLRPFWSYGEYWAGSKQYLDEILLNIILFVPIGLIASSLDIYRRWWAVLLFGLLSSCGIECLQLLLHRGLCETDDVIHNTIGCLIGYLIWKGLMMLKTKL